MTAIFISTEDPELYSLLEYILDAEGFTTRLVADPQEVRGHSCIGRTVVILDANSTALGFCRSVAKDFDFSSMTVIGLVRPGASPSHLDLLRSGAMECLTRPINLTALLELIRTATGREGCGVERSPKPQVQLDPSERSVTWQGKTARLSPIEFALFADLYAHHGHVRKRSDLVIAARRSKRNLSSRGIDVHVCRLRRSLAPLASSWIETIRSSGYKLLVPPTD